MPSTWFGHNRSGGSRSGGRAAIARSRSNQAQREHDETERPHRGRAAGRRSHEYDPNDRWIPHQRMELPLGFVEEAFVEAEG